MYNSDLFLVLQRLARRRLIRNSCLCPTCAIPCRLWRYNHVRDGYRWSCRNCTFAKSIRIGSFFERSHLSLLSLITVLYFWALDCPQLVMINEGRVSEDTATSLCHLFRQECLNYLQRHNLMEIGGIDDDCVPLEVEIDESFFFHRRNHRGRFGNGRWVFGGIERGSRKCFMVQVENRREGTLRALIEQHIRPGTHIISDGWAAYANISTIGNGIYSHSVINHSENFVHPLDPNIHTQNIENAWMRVKRKLKRQSGTSRDKFPSYIPEFLFRNFFRSRQIFGHILVAIKEHYLV